MQEFIALAKGLADASGEIIRDYYRRPLDIESKADETPVTIADRTVEKRLREMIEAARPDDGILGEEFGLKDSNNGLSWVIDPIDGTKAFMTGFPTFGTLIALCENGAPILGVLDQPILRDRWIGARGMETVLNGDVVKTRPCSSPDQAIARSTTPDMFAEEHYPILKTSFKHMIWGGDCIGYGALASGFVDIVIEAQMQPYDYLSMAPIIEGAGGRICDFNGQPLTMNSGDTVVAVGDPVCMDALAPLLNLLNS